jgi:hypothetical protein
VRLYPLDCAVADTAELVLCCACWQRANQLRENAGLAPLEWDDAELYCWTPEPNEHRYDYAVQQAAWDALRDRLKTPTRPRAVVPHHQDHLSQHMAA